MAVRESARVQPSVLRWARLSAAVSEEAAARRLGIKPERLSAWESDDDESLPTLAQLRQLADLYHRPLAAFFRSEPPPQIAAVKDFRRLDPGIAGVITPALAREIRRARFRRQVALDLFEEIDGASADFGFVARPGENTSTVARRLREFLQVTVEHQKGWPSGRISFNRWRASIEGALVLVFQTDDISLEEARGFSLFFERLPVIVVNRKDVPSAKIFTLIHELIHLGLRDAGLCDLEGPSDVEAWCNAVAAEFLVPTPEVIDLVGNDESVRRVAETFGVSEEVVWRRLLTLGHISARAYDAKRQELAARFQEFQDQRRRDREGGSGGPAPSRESVSLGGRFFTGLVLAALDGGVITAADAAEFIGVRRKHFEKVVRELSLGDFG